MKWPVKHVDEDHRGCNFCAFKVKDCKYDHPDVVNEKVLKHVEQQHPERFHRCPRCTNIFTAHGKCMKHRKWCESLTDEQFAESFDY